MPQAFVLYYMCVDLTFEFQLTSEEGNVGVLGVVRAACHPADLLSQSLQGVRLGSQTR